MTIPENIQRLKTPVKADLRVTRGDSVKIVYVLKDALTQTRIPLTGLSGKATVKKAVDDRGPIWELGVEVSQSPAGSADTGQVVITATGTQTTLFPEFGIWGLQLSDDTPDGEVRKTVAMGKLIFTRDV